NISITDLAGVAKSLLDLKHQPFVFDVYKKGYVLAWTEHNQIWNLMLVQKGFARPEQDPPTHLVDRLFADHFWFKMQKG
ncbi:MAG: hypothetical protein GY729_17505, partial [Desulfobacteraceae bacterium]|nr:hypothetical protein [Desulfobacteraceae bacterium]